MSLGTKSNRRLELARKVSKHKRIAPKRRKQIIRDFAKAKKRNRL